MRRRFARGFGLQLAWRVAIEGFSARIRRQATDAGGQPDPVFVVACLVAVACLATFGVVFGGWLLTGRGPGGRWLEVGQGGPRQRVPT